MPNYNAQTIPYSLAPGDVGYAFDNESPAPPQASVQFAIATPFDGSAGNPSEVRVDIRYAAQPTAVSVEVQSAIDDVDADYVTEYTSTNVAGESVKLSNFRGRFIRVLLASQTAGGAITARILR